MTIKQKIIDIYGAGYLRRSAINIEGGEAAFAWALEGKGYENVLEIGTYRGVSAAVMAQYCEQVITIDLVHGRREQLNETFKVGEFWQSLGIDNIHHIRVIDEYEKARMIDGADFDFAFVDGAHDETVWDDFQMVKRCGRVLFHDYNDDGDPAHAHVLDLVRSLPPEEVQTMGIFALWQREGFDHG